MSQNKDYRRKEGVSLVTNAVQEIWGKKCDSQLRFGICKKFHFVQWCLVGQFTLCKLASPLLPSDPSFPSYARSSWTAQSKEDGEARLQISLCLCLRFFLSNNSSGGNLSCLWFVSLPPQMMSKCYRAARISVLLNCCLIKQWEQRRLRSGLYANWKSFICLQDYLA